MTKTFKNKNFIKRDYEATNIICCVADKAPNENYIECDDVLDFISKAIIILNKEIDKRIK